MHMLYAVLSKMCYHFIFIFFLGGGRSTVTIILILDAIFALFCIQMLIRVFHEI